jgi:hypothetical protein
MPNQPISHSGVVRMEVKIFPETVPLRKRTRQNYSYTFNSFTLGQVSSNNINNIETVTVGDSSTGITVKKEYAIYHTVFANSYSDVFSNFSSDNSPKQSPLYSRFNAVDVTLDFAGQSLYRNIEQSAMKDHQTFVLEGSLFSAIRNSEDLEYLIRDQGIIVGRDGQIYKALSSLLPKPETLEVRQDVSSSRPVARGSIGGRSFNPVGFNDSPFFGFGGSNGLSFNVAADIERGLGSDFADSSGLWSRLDISRLGTTSFSSIIGYVGITNVFTSDIQELLRSIGFVSVSKANFGNSFEDSAYFDDTVPAINGINIDGNVAFSPGVHASFRKAAPIFPGEDFTLRFKKLSVQHPVSSGDSDENGPVRYVMKKEYRCIDSAFNRPGVFSSNAFKIPMNYGVAPFYFKTGDGDNRPYLDPKASNYYLAHQPYVVIEINGGPEQRFYLMIPYNGSVVLLEESSGLIEYDYINENKDIVPFVEKPSFPVSRVVYDFGFRGSSLLDLDYFSVDVQHYRGSLQVTFDNEPSKSHVITRKYFGREHFSSNSSFAGTTRSRQKDTIKNSEKLVYENVPIKLNGILKVHMGNVKMAFNFSPISYVRSNTLKITNPVGISNLDGNKDVVNIILRSSGGYGESENAANKINAEKIRNENGYVVPGQSEPFYIQQANIFVETVNGKKSKVGIEGMPFSYRQLVTGPNAIDNMTTEIGSLKSGSKIITGFNLTDPGEFINRIYPHITLQTGTFSFRSFDGKYFWDLSGATRPICDGFSVFVPEGVESAWEPVSADVTVNAMSFSDNWNRSDRTFLQHSGSIKFYLNKSDSLPILESLSAIETEKGSLFSGVRKAEKFNTKGAVRYGESVGDMSAFLASLQDKFFYIQVKAWRDPVKTRTHGVGLADNYSKYGSGEDSFFGTHQNKFPNDDNTVIFTGICTKSVFNVLDSHIEMNCTLNDYWYIFDNMRWLNAPFYDAMRDYNAVMDVMQKAGFFYENGKNSPGYLIKKYVDTPSNGDYYEVSYDGYKVIANDYVLPGSYNSLNSPMFKPKTGSQTYGEFLKSLANICGKVLYFDRKGVMHFDVPEDELELFQVEGSSPGKPLYQAIPFDVFGFTYSVVNNKQVNWWNVIIGDYVFDRVVSDIVNEIRVVSSTPEGSLVSAAHMNRASMSDIDLPGFIGFRKMFLHKSGYFGSGAAVRKIVERYTTMFNAPVHASFNVLGRVGLQTNQTILVDGPGNSGPYRLLLTNVSNKIEPKENSWTCSLEGRYFLPGEKIKFSNTTLTLGAGTGG